MVTDTEVSRGCEGVGPGTSEKTKRDIRGRNQCGLWGGREFNVVGRGGRCGGRGSVRAPPRLGAIPWTQRHARRREGSGGGAGWATPMLCGAINGLSGWVGGGASRVERVYGPFEGCVTHFEAACCFYRRKV